MNLKFHFIFLLGVISFQGYSQEIKSLENEKLLVIKQQIDAVQKNNTEKDESYKFQLGRLYYDLFAEEFDWYGGNNYDKNQAKEWFNTAIKYLEQSAEQNYWAAQDKLGEIYSNTPDYNGDPENYNDGEKAIYWYSKAIEHGKPESFYNLGLIYYSGNGGNESVKDDEKALIWIKKAAEAGYAPAQSDLGDIYYYGKIALENDEKAFYWYNKANENGSRLSTLGEMYYHGRGTSQSYTKAYEMFKKAYDRYPPDDRTFNDATACYYLGLMYYYGNYVEKDLRKAFLLIEQGAMIGNSKARGMLGYLHYYGDGTLIDKKLAFTWLKLGANSGINKQAQYLLGIMYFYGEANPVDKKSAAYWMKKAFENGSSDAKEFWDKNEMWKIESKI